MAKQKALPDPTPDWLRDFIENSKEIVKKFGHDGQITRKDLADSISNGSANGPLATPLVVLYKNFNLLGHVVRTYTNPDGKEGVLSIADIESVPRAIEEDDKRNLKWLSKAEADDLVAEFGGANGHNLTASDIETAITLLELTDDTHWYHMAAFKNHQRLGNLKGIREELDRISCPSDHGSPAIDNLNKNEGFSAGCISDYASSLWHDAPFKRHLSLRSDLDSGKMRESMRVEDNLYNDSLGVLDSITAQAVLQGETGDCYFEAVLASLALVSPESIRDATQANGNGKYSVTFLGAKDNPIRAMVPNTVEQRVYSRPSGFGYWPALWEKSYGIYRAYSSPPTPSFLDLEPLDIRNDTPQDVAGHGGTLEEAARLLTGQEPRTISISNSPDVKASLVEQMTHAFPSGRRPQLLVTAGISILQPSGNYGSTVDGFTKAHAYTIMAFAPDGRGGGEVTVRNPHAGDGLEGTVTISLDKFIENFSLVVIGQLRNP
jgi:hypothetical protein